MNSWLCIDLLDLHTVFHIAIQGQAQRSNGLLNTVGMGWVTHFVVQYSDDDENWEFYKSEGETNEFTVLEGNTSHR